MIYLKYWIMSYRSIEITIMPKNLLTPQELADELGIKISTVYHWSHMGYIPIVKLGNLLRFRRSSIERWIDKKEKKEWRRVVRVL